MTSRASTIFDQAKSLAGNNDTGLDEFLLAALTRAQAYWADRLPWPALERRETFVHGGGVKMVLPARVAAVMEVADLATNRRVDKGGQFTLGTAFNQEAAGTPDAWRPTGFMPVAAQPQTDAKLTISSSQSEAMSVLVRGLVRDTARSGTALELYEAQETVTLAGAAVDTGNSYVEVFAVEKPANTTASVTVADAYDGSTIARLPAWDTNAQYRAIEFNTAPNAGTEFKILYLSAPQEVTSTGHAIETAIDPEFLVWRIAGDIHWLKQQSDAARIAWSKAEEIIQNRVAHENSGGGMTPTAPGGHQLDFSDSNPFWF